MEQRMAANAVIASRHVFLNHDFPDVPAALVVRAGRVVARVPYEQAKQYECEGAPLFDFGGSFICPGFHDAHQHVFHTALFPSEIATSYCGKNEQDCVRHLQEFSARAPNDGWLIGQGYRYALWDPPRVPTKDSLDAAFPDRPVAMYSGDCHNLWLNSAGLRILGIDRETRPPHGGIIERDVQGIPTGVLREAAAMLYASRIFKSIPSQMVKSAYEGHFQRMLSQGLTSLCDMALCPLPGADCVNEGIYEELESEGKLAMRVHLFPQLIGDLDRILALRARLRGSLLRAPGMKQFFDGVSSAHTAWLLEPYSNPYFAGDSGRPTIEPEKMRELIMNAAEHHIPVRIHAIGDRSVSEALEIIRDAQVRFGVPEQGRNSLEHIENLTREDAQLFSQLGVVASVQPQHLAIDTEQPARDLGEARAAFMWPFATYAETGAVMAFGTDAPCSPANWREVLSCAVWRQNPQTRRPTEGWLSEQKISMRQALSAYSHGSAYVVGREGELGTLDVGKYADIAVCNENLLTCGPEALLEASMRATFVGGELVWEQ
ncbi:amidohydrolase [Actinobaculum massiliense]|uniref:amidohydrolase n=1 Tax=Actinobaculum massiliense TaxID=202789 RepID=UPI00254A3D8F|nr:amidohydrolase [Actinobaculum massiliense]MDK8319593.1 amidohydrolase [Actinobaculum massiliense]